MRNSLKFRSHVFNRGTLHTPVWTGHKFVFAGESAAFNVKGALEGDVQDELRSPALVNHYLFYVPLRLIWSGFTDWFADPDSGLSVPTTTAQFAAIMENTAGQTYNAFKRRAYKLVYNTFFGDESIGQAANAWYTDVTADTVVQVNRLKVANQIISELMSDSDVPVDNYSVVANTIEMTEFQRRLTRNRANIRQRFTGEKYTDALARLGVRVSDALIAQPELLGMVSKLIYPENTYGTSGADIGKRVGRYAARIEHNVGRKFFAEHGVVIGICGLRPILARLLEYPDSTSFGFAGSPMVDRDSYIMDQDRPWLETPLNVWGYADAEPDPIIMRSAPWLYGDISAANAVTGVAVAAGGAGSVNLLRYPGVGGIDPDFNLSVAWQAIGTTPLSGKVRT